MGTGRITVAALVSATAGLLLAACVPVAGLVPHDLGTLGGTHSTATDVNATGLVVGWAEALDGRTHAFKAEPGGPLQRLDGDGPEASRANAVNGPGAVAGTRGDKAVVWTPEGTEVTLPTPDVGAGPGIPVAFIANDLNDAGVVVGTISLLYGESTAAFVYRPDTGTLTRLGAVPGDARAINTRGQIVGWQLIEGSPTGVVWNPDGQGGWQAAEALPATAASRWGQAADIADDGTVVGTGYDRTQGLTRALVWPGGGRPAIEVPTPPGSATADGVDAAGVVVGSLNASGDIWNPQRIAYRWQVGGDQPEGLAGIGGPLSEAWAVNGRGEIVGRGNPPGQPSVLHAIRWGVTSRPVAEGG